MNKLVSIVLPTYNGQDFLKKSIDSCLTQTYQNIELIIINDCSTDNSDAIINSYNDDRIKYIKNEINKKLPKSLNVGFSLAKGDYYTWTSDDNYFDINAIEEMVNALESQKVDLVCAPYFTIDNNGVITGERTVGKQCDVLIDNVVKACFLYKKEVHQKLNGYTPGLFLVEDYDFWIRATFENFHFYQLTEKLYYYRFHENSLTDTRRDEISNALFSLLQKHLKLFKTKGKKEFISSSLYLKLAKLSIANNKKGSFFYLKNAIKMRPRILCSSQFIKILFKTMLKV